MSAASDVTALRQIIAQYSVGAAAKNAWTTSQPISTSDTITGNNVYAAGSLTAMKGLTLPPTYLGTATLSNAATTVIAPVCTASSFVFITAKNISGSQGTLSVTPGTGSFIINSTNAGDRSTVQWMIVTPA
jgi:hypothetical protein